MCTALNNCRGEQLPVPLRAFHFLLNTLLLTTSLLTVKHQRRNLPRPAQV